MVRKFDCGYNYVGGYCKYSPFPKEGFKKLCAFSDRKPHKNGWKGEKWKICPKMVNYEEEYRKKMGLEAIRRRI
jgi:hypothetical protein